MCRVPGAVPGAWCQRHPTPSTKHSAPSTAPGTQHHGTWHSTMIWIAVDAMGGDYAPRHVVDGALAAVRHFDLGVLLVGPTSILEEELARHADVDQRRVRIIEADEVVTMEESPTAALRRKPAASIRIA